MFCENCGKENPAGATFCEGCGSALEGVQGGNDKGKKIAVLAGGIAVLLILLAIFGVFTPGSVKAAKKLTKGYINGNAKAVWDVTVSPYSEQWEMDKDEKKEALEEAKEEAKETKAERKEDGIKISLKKVKKVKDYKKSDVKKIAERLEDMGYETDEYKLQDVHVVKVTTVTKSDGDKDTDSEEMVMIKVKGKWYMDTYLTMAGRDGIKGFIKADKD